MNKERIYIGIFILSLLLFVTYEWMKPQPIDWTESYSGLDKIPYGCYIIRDMLPQLFPGEELSNQNEPIFTAEWDSTTSRNVIYINQSFAPDEYEADKLVQQVNMGYNIFIAANSISGNLADTLGIKIYRPAPFFEDSTGTDSLSLNFQNRQLREEKPWIYSEAITNAYFTSFDSLNTTILGKTVQNRINYIKISRGDGALYLHSMPEVFSNFHMLHKRRVNYAFKALSYLPIQPTTWDEYYKLGRSTTSSPMRYIISHEYLRWGWGTALLALLLFMIFRAKRRQRIIPAIDRPKNTTLEFTKTIGRLYFEHGSRKNIAEKKITYFLQYIRTRLRLDTETFDQGFLNNVASRTGIDYDTAVELFNEISAVQEKSSLSSRELQSLNRKIEHFYQKTSR
ncbi:hypothetical protein NC796_18745 [Aliifodinibius sp. S!AR15-10]|uniref:DUF4350 domain-containing protein n=1 Tax=Aliifodinibius sp. S!AR15-10 TaxID=2950437 RepID=UPI00285D2C4A|nr:DUF4350 domain-containing protein [Aliifodinibius sp. S!AR15-10]MDR8393201.1 hypothetical protein [Aliifodinibius sp. S!AR15-10]